MRLDNIENTFRNSNDSNELFDIFHSALEQGVNDVELYKILLGNPVLSDDELCMYSEKIASILPGKSFETFLWAASLLEVHSSMPDSAEKSLQYYAKAAKQRPNDFLPYKNSLNLFNYEINTPFNKHIIKFIENGIPVVEKKSVLYKTLAKHFKKMGDNNRSKNYELLAHKSAKRE